jgi:hypothetical protein
VQEELEQRGPTLDAMSACEIVSTVIVNPPAAKFMFVLLQNVDRSRLDE